MFNFKDTEAATGASWLTPGVWPLKPTKVELGKFLKGTPFLAVTLTSEEGTNYTEKFVLSEKALGRIQYLHEAFFGKKCEKNFTSEKELETYFRKALTGKEFVRNIVIGGEISNGTVYATLPYTNFVVPEDSDLEVGEFEEGDANWKKYVKKRVNTVSGGEDQPNGLLDEDDDDEIGTAKKEAPKTNKKEDPKKPTKKEEKKEEKEDDDLPW
jgi:hypothetical protein